MTFPEYLKSLGASDEDVKALNQAKKQGDAASVVGKYEYEADMFDEAEGEPWDSPKAEAKPEDPEAIAGKEKWNISGMGSAKVSEFVVAAPEVKTPEWQVSAEPEKSKGHIAFFGSGERQKELYQLDNGDIYPIPFEYDYEPTIEEFQMFLDQSKEIILGLLTKNG